MIYPYIIVDDRPDDVPALRAMADSYANLRFEGQADNYDEALDLILEKQPLVVFLEIDPRDNNSRLSLHLINEVFRFLKVPPKFIVTTHTSDQVIQALRYEAFDYLLKPLSESDFRKTIFRLNKAIGDDAPLVTLPIVFEESSTQKATQESITAEPDNHIAAEMDEPIVVQPQGSIQLQEEKPLIICVKSYGDYRFINADDICYLQADNNSTDIHLNNGEMITAFKTLKHFENVLKSPFVRIHNSYIVNIDYVSRIHTGNSVCYIKNSGNKLPFSKSYKENVDAILLSITKGNYLEI